MKYENLKRVFFKFEPENAHKIAEFGMNFMENLPIVREIFEREFCYENEILSQEIFGLNFKNPICIGGGFDKNATMINALTRFGFGFLEYGTMTPKPQPGNPKPRLFRLIKEESIQNAMGFNNEGAEIIAKRVAKVFPAKVPLIANIGKNKITPNNEALKDYEILLSKFDPFCDMFVINISSPNTPNLRDLQNENFINELFSLVKVKTTKPVFVKIAPDMEIKSAIILCENAINAGSKGIVINNTSIDYSLSPNARNFGGLSGKLITEKSRKFFAEISREIFGSATLISCGGIDNAEEAYERIKLGASLIQIFTSFIFKGPGICKNINENLAKILKNDGFENIKDAVGVGIKR